ncbi:MAG: hypothetical protein ACE5KH_03940, partial [Candidatus Geothermarchaeales archaeon]
MNEFDVVIVGAGTAGSSLAEYVAHRGLGVALVDRKPRGEIGDKACGDAIDPRHFEITGFKPPASGDTVNRVKGIRVYPPNLKVFYTLTSVYGNGYMVDRHRDGQTRMKRAVKEGAVLFDNCLAKRLLLKDGFARGVRVLQIREDEGRKTKGDEVDIKARVTVDASGWQGVLYRDTPDEWGMDKEIGPGERIDSSRDIVEVRDPRADGAIPLEPEYLDIILTERFAPGGYVWRFPAHPNAEVVNVGNAVAVRPGVPKSRPLLEEYYSFDAVFRGCRRLRSATWPIPVRRPRGKLVGNGFAALGDAAIQIDPTTAEGIGYGLGGAWFLGKTMCEALEAGRNPSAESLWPYAWSYMTSSEYGLRQVRFDVFRLFLQSGTDRDFNGAMTYGLIREVDLLGSVDADVKIGLLDRLRRGLVSSVTGQMSLLRR